MAVVAVCAMMVAVCVLFSRQGDGQDEQTATRHKDKSRPVAVAVSSGKATPNQVTEKSAEPDLKFLDVMWPFLPERHQQAVRKAKIDGKVNSPTTFSEMAKFLGMIEAVVQRGEVRNLYDALDGARTKEPTNINLARMCLLVSSIGEFSQDEYNKNLEKLAEIDSNEDVTLLCMKLQLERGESESAYSLAHRNLTEHPDQASSTLTSALRMFTAARANEQKALVVEELKKLNLDAFQADCCGRCLYDANDRDDAAHFYMQNVSRENNPYFREVAQVRLCKVQIANGTQNEQTIETLKELALNSDTPAIKAEAHKALSSINVELPHQRDNSNNKPVKTN